MLEIQNACKTFNAGTVNEKVALNNLNLKLENGDFVTVIGGNGAGKSTMLNAICGVWPLDSGKILIDGQDVSKLPEYKRTPLPELSGTNRIDSIPDTDNGIEIIECRIVILAIRSSCFHFGNN